MAAKTWAAGDSLNATNLNAEIRDKLNLLAAAFATPIWMDATRFVSTAGSPASAPAGSAGGILEFPAWAFDAASDETLVGTFRLPDYWDAGDITIKVRWAPSSTNTGNVIWDVAIAAIAAAEQIDQAADETESATQAGSGTTDNLHETSALTFSPTSNFIRVTVNRDANNAGDTFTADAYFLGLVIEFGVDVGL